MAIEGILPDAKIKMSEKELERFETEQAIKQGLLFLNPADAYNLIQSTDGKFFSATYVKRSTGITQTMICRLKVTSHLKGGALPYDPKAKQLVIVFKVSSKEKGKKADTSIGYRAIPLDAMLKLSIGGTVYCGG